MPDLPLTSKLQNLFEKINLAHQSPAHPPDPSAQHGSEHLNSPDSSAGPKDIDDDDDDESSIATQYRRKMPAPLLRLELRDLRHDATQVFLDNVDAAEDLAGLVGTVANLLYFPPATLGGAATPTSQESIRPHPYKPHIPGTRSVTVVVRQMDGVAYTTGTDLDDDHKEIHFSLSFIADVARQATKCAPKNPGPDLTQTSDTPPKPKPTAIIGGESTAEPSQDDDNDGRSSVSGLAADDLPRGRKAAIRHELLGVLCHELVHCFQWNAKGTANGGLIEGIADYIRLRAGYVPPHWKREAKGKKWDAGYQITGYFLDWLENAKGEGGVRRLNEALRDQEWNEKTIWNDVYGEDVESLWKRYGKQLKD